MRIIAGAKRGMRLLSPKTEESRPITDRVKESLFNVLLQYDLPAGKMVADLFSGVGSLGLEALSRAAEFVTFVEKDPKIIAILNKNIEKAGFVGVSKVIRANAFKIGAPVEYHVGSSGIRHAVCQYPTAVVEKKYDLIFVDPPYSTTEDIGENSLLSGLMAILSEQLAADGIVVVRTHKRTVLGTPYGELLERYPRDASQRHSRLEIIERRQWGTMAVTILQ